MFASDLHGSAYYTKKVAERFLKEQAEKLILLGDFLYHGARNDPPEEYGPKAVAPVLNALKDKILAVRGNCDSEIDQVVLEFPMLAPYAMMYVDGHDWFITHGDHYNETDMPAHTPGTVLIHGHTHVKAMERIDDFYYMNPGSAAMPKDDALHTYMTYEDGVFTIRDLEDGSPLRELVL